MDRHDREITVEVVYALPGKQLLVELSVAPGTTALEAITQSGLLARFPQIDPGHQTIGIFGRAVKADAVLQAGDRVEIYRPLVAEPKEARRRRAARKR
ncbi:MAG: RnfH family protein [Burkholderiales bacterium]|nr:RnfH family protein [Burkholderiales bacterium]